MFTMSGKDTERFDGLLLSMAHECKDGGVQEMIDLIFRFVNMFTISVLVRTHHKQVVETGF